MKIAGAMTILWLAGGIVLADEVAPPPITSETLFGVWEY
jgi:hypothetical protein